MIVLALLQAVASVAADPGRPAPATDATSVTRATSAPVAERFSILVEPCARMGTTAVGNDIVVCGSKADGRRLPLADERVAVGPTPSNPDRTGLGALAATPTPCAALQGGCQVGFGAPLVAAAIDGVVTALSDGLADRKARAARRRDAGRRVPIPLDGSPAVPAR